MSIKPPAATHTPGPWRVFEVLTDPEIVTDRPTAYLTESIVQFKGQANARANARLMAAAPRLLDACRMVVERWETGDLAEAARMCQAAIAEAIAA